MLESETTQRDPRKVRAALTKEEIEVLRELGRQVADIAHLPVQQETIESWKALNRLDPARPMVLINHVPWHEIDVCGELELRTEDSFCRDIETVLRRTLYSWKHMRADMVVEPFIRIPKSISGLGEDLGIKRKEEIAVTDVKSAVVGHRYTDQFETEAGLEMIRTPNVALDRDATAAAEQRANEIFDGILGVRMEGHFPRFTPWDRIVEWHGADIRCGFTDNAQGVRGGLRDEMVRAVWSSVLRVL